MLLFAAAFDVKINWLAKHNLFYPPIGWVMRAMGGIPITRHRSGHVVSALVDAFAAHEHLALAVPTEGTRTRSDYWKSGFYHIASGAGVPIIPSYLDYGARRGGFGPALELSGNLVADMDTLRSFYAPMQGKFPEQFGPVRLREEQGS
jgi:1-acyl-sn-glycerol-3-phosphate acyltransferase